MIDTLYENDLDNIEEIKKAPGTFVVRCTYVFDSIEIEGAEEYADEEYGKDRDESWYEEFFLPYLNDMAVDNVNDIADEMGEDYEVNYEMVSCELSKENYDEMNFIIAFYNEVLPFDFDDLITDLV